MGALKLRGDQGSGPRRRTSMAFAVAHCGGESEVPWFRRCRRLVPAGPSPTVRVAPGKETVSRCASKHSALSREPSARRDSTAGAIATETTKASRRSGSGALSATAPSAIGRSRVAKEGARWPKLANSRSVPIAARSAETAAKKSAGGDGGFFMAKGFEGGPQGAGPELAGRATAGGGVKQKRAQRGRRVSRHPLSNCAPSGANPSASSGLFRGDFQRYVAVKLGTREDASSANANGLNSPRVDFALQFSRRDAKIQRGLAEVHVDWGIAANAEALRFCVLVLHVCPRQGSAREQPRRIAPAYGP